MLGIDFRGHGDSDAGPSTFGMLEVEDVAGALAWLGERGITRVALIGTSMGGMAAIAVGRRPRRRQLAAADMDPSATHAPVDAPRPAIVAVVADSTPPERRDPGRQSPADAVPPLPGGPRRSTPRRGAWAPTRARPSPDE